jgi:hypothetical protein
MDFEEGARLEAEDINAFYNVGRALERVQGKVRLTIEQHRAGARLEAMKRAEELRKQRYGELRAAEQRVLEQQAATAPATPPEVPAAPQPATIDDPFGVGGAQPAPAGPVAPVEPAPAMGAPGEAQQQPPLSTVPTPAGTDQDPFATPAGAEIPPGTTRSGVFGAIGKALGKAITGEEEGTTATPSDDPFDQGAAPAMKQPAMPGQPQPGAPGEDPFAPAPAGQQAAPGDDPFAEGAAPAIEQPAMPGQPQPGAPGEDPFAPAPAGKEPAAADAGTDPFVEEQKPEPAQPPAPANDDPFAADP